MDTLKLGQLIEGEQHRDATHIAVAPVRIADTKTYPGNHVGLNPDGSVSEIVKPHIGILDPFLPESPLRMGDVCWLFLYPGTIKGLRHQWEHPAFDGKAESPPAEPSKATSRKWLEDIASRCGVGYERMMDAVDSDDFINMGENEQYRSILEGDTYQEFQKHCSVVLGREIKDAYPFSCSC